MAEAAGWFQESWQGEQWVLSAGGRWDIATVERLAARLHPAGPKRPPEQGICIDLGAVTALDTAGAITLEGLAERLRGQGHTVAIVGARPDLCTLLKAVRRSQQVKAEPAAPPHPNVDVLERVGRATVEIGYEATGLLSFLGQLCLVLWRAIRNPRRIRVVPFLYHLEQVGLNALPIVGLLSFLIGVVLAYQGADQLRRFGAEIFVVNLLGVGVLREIGILMTSIIVAGRSGSAFTAQIGTMKVSQELDAMQTLGLDPLELLVLPRMLALMVALPLLGFYADVVGLMGGALMSYFALDITFGQFLKQLQQAVTPTTLAVGLVKAPVFAAIISMIGCYEGLKVTGSAESVGRLTTRSVVESIFLVIVVDAFFSILFSYLDI